MTQSQEPSARASVMMAISDREFQAIAGLVKQRFGVNLTDQKRHLVVGRLQKLLKDANFATFSDYLSYVESDASGQALIDMVNRITTNHTYFYRENEHFDYLASAILPALTAELRRKRQLDLRVWCAGCSSGEEAYMLAMLIREHLGADGGKWQAGLLATDISLKALRKARAGVYPADRVEPVPRRLRDKYFQEDAEGRMRAADMLRQDITFRQFNLMNAAFPFRQPFHVIFCRNVMIYFDQPTREALVERLYRSLAPGGYFVIGLSESVRGSANWECVKPSVYRRPA